MILNDELKLVIILQDGSEHIIYNDNINSLSITQQAISSGFNLGGVNTATMSATLKVDGLTDTSMYAAIIKVYKMINSEWNSQGVFNVTSAKAYRDIITVSASDNLIFTNKEVYTIENGNKKVNDIAEYLKTERTLYEVFCYIVIDCCGLEVAQSQEEFESIQGGDIHTIVFDDVKTDCPRDWLSWIAQAVGAFAYCDNDGKVIVKRFEETATDTIALNEIQNDSLSIADYTMLVCGVRMDKVWDGSSGSWWFPDRDGKPNSVYIEVSDNWIIQGKHYLYGNAMDVLGNIFSAIDGLAYRPFSATVHSNKQYYIGQCVNIENYDGSLIKTVISKRTYTLNGGQKLESSGIDSRVLSENSQRTKLKLETEKLMTEIENVKGKSVTEDEMNIIIESGKYREGDVFYIYE